MSTQIDFVYVKDLPFKMIVSDIKTKPSSAKNFLPKWYKDMDPYTKSDINPTGRKLLVFNQSTNATAKKCIPMLDGIGSGYIVPLWCDVSIIQRKNKEDNKFYPVINWRINEDVFQVHGPSSRDIPPPFGYNNLVFKYTPWFRIRTPKGYSIMVSSPFGHYQLPFHAIPAVIDSDKSVIDNNFPCWVQEGFEGIVEKGTPMVQITPFKRENWKSNFKKMDYKEFEMEDDIGFKSNLINNYVRNQWSKKEYK